MGFYDHAGEIIAGNGWGPIKPQPKLKQLFMSCLGAGQHASERR
jgi:hypothetical protein